MLCNGLFKFVIRMSMSYLDDQVPLGITSHSGELCSQLLELGPAVSVNHPA